MESSRNYGQYLDGLDMQRYYSWINSNDPDAIAKRKSDEEKQQEYLRKAKQEQLDYEQFIKDNPDVVERCREMAIKQIESITERYLRAAFENNKLKESLRKMFTK